MSLFSPRVLLIADSPGHILERIARSWLTNYTEARFRLECSELTHPYLLANLALQQDVVHWIDPLGFQLHAKAIDKPQIVMFHHATEEELEFSIEQLKFSDCVTTVSRRWKNRLESVLDHEVFLLPNTVNTDIFKIEPQREQVRLKYKIPSGDFVIGFVGKATANAFGRKGLDLFQEVIVQATKRWKDITVVIIGKGWNELKASLCQKGIRVLVVEVASTEETASIYPLMDTLLITSTEEGGPCTALEAMSCGVPVISSDVGHIPEVIVHGRTGMICPDRTVLQYLESLELLIQNNEFRSAMIDAGRRFIEYERDEKTIVPRLELNKIHMRAIINYSKRNRTQTLYRHLLPYRILQARYLAAGLRNQLKK